MNAFVLESEEKFYLNCFIWLGFELFYVNVFFEETLKNMTLTLTNDNWSWICFDLSYKIFFLIIFELKESFILDQKHFKT